MKNEVHDAVFNSALELWKRDTCFFSSSTQIMDHNGFRVIAAMGNAAVVPLLEELSSSPWVGISLALQVITNATPEVAEEDYGKVDVVAQAWFKWGYDNKYFSEDKFIRLSSTLAKVKEQQEKLEKMFKNEK